MSVAPADDGGGGYDGGYGSAPVGTVGGGGGDYSGAGGYVGGYSPAGTGNLSSYTGVGSASGYQSFTPLGGGGWQGLGNLPFNIPSKPYKGLGGITSGGNTLLGILQSIFGQYQQGQISNVEALSEATQLSGMLGNSSVFYQAQHGKDASALANFKTQAQGIVASIATWVAPTAPTTTPTTPDPQTDNPTTATDILTQLQGILNGGGAPSSTNFNAPPNLYQVTPNQSTGSGSSMQKIIIMAVVAVAAYFLYKKYA
jgi:hypothetical protein